MLSNNELNYVAMEHFVGLLYDIAGIEAHTMETESCDIVMTVENASREVLERINRIGERFFGFDFECWDDSYVGYCSQCGKIYLTESSEGVYTSYDYYCPTCLLENENVQENYLDELLNNSNKAIEPWFENVYDLEGLGFELAENQSEGYYNWCSNSTSPHKLLEKYELEGDVIFKITENSPFHTEYECWVRKF